MQTSLQRISLKARRLKKYRFRNLYGMLNVAALHDSWRYVRKTAAAGVDKVTATMYQMDIDKRIKALASDLKAKRYRAKLVKRAYIPKGDGKMRPLGIPATSDKLIQTASTRILNAIFEEDFLPCSFGYRPRVGAKQAVKALSAELQFGNYRYVVEADIKGFFDNIDHEWLMRMLRERIDDRAFERLIRKWLKAGVLDKDGTVLEPDAGTPQGGSISPVLANIYLHYALDLWFEKVVKPRCSGKAYLCRFADDFVGAFERKEDADRFYHALEKRLGKFKLQLSAEKTKVISFSRQGGEKNRFLFLGFEFRWGVSRKNKPLLKRRTAPKKFQKAVKEFTEWCKSTRHATLKLKMNAVNVKLRGHYNYFGLIGNYRSLKQFVHQAKRALFKWLNRRSQRRSYNWTQYESMLKRYGFMSPRITETNELQRAFQFC